jgi:hypothetical protein
MEYWKCQSEICLLKKSVCLSFCCKFPSNYSKVSKFLYILCWNFIFFEKFDWELAIKWFQLSYDINIINIIELLYIFIQYNKRSHFVFLWLKLLGILRIRYVSELQIEEDYLKFSLPVTRSVLDRSTDNVFIQLFRILYILFIWEPLLSMSFDLLWVHQFCIGIYHIKRVSSRLIEVHP